MNNQDPKHPVEIRSLNHADFSEISQLQDLDDEIAAQVYGGCGALTSCNSNKGSCPSLDTCRGNSADCPSLTRCGGNSGYQDGLLPE